MSVIHDAHTPFPNPYVDPGLTQRNNPPLVVPTPLPAKSGSTTLGEVTVYDIPGVDHEPSNRGVVPAAHAPNSWAIADDANDIPRSRDLYANGGALGQTFLNNPSVVPEEDTEPT